MKKKIWGDPSHLQSFHFYTFQSFKINWKAWEETWIGWDFSYFTIHHSFPLLSNEAPRRINCFPYFLLFYSPLLPNSLSTFSILLSKHNAKIKATKVAENMVKVLPTTAVSKAIKKAPKLLSQRKTQDITKRISLCH